MSNSATTQNAPEAPYQQALMARQPIFDRDVNVVAYELLFRGRESDQANVIDGDHATSELLVNAFTQFNINEVIGQKQAFVNFTAPLLKTPPPFDASRLVIELLEDVPINDELVHDLEQLKAAGYTIALDDFIHTEAADRILPLADIVKIDVLLLDDAGIKEHVDLIAPYGARLLAEKVETHEMYEQCKALGFEMFQGFFLSKPQLLRGRKLAASKLLVMELLSKLQDPETPIEDLERLIGQDPALSYKTLKLVNSAAYCPVQRIDSLSRAITYLGMNTLRSLASLLALSNLSDKPNALKDQSAIRAKLCESIGEKICRAEAPVYFSVGLLSCLDAYFDTPLSELLDSLALDERIERALLAHEGVYGETLKLVTALEEARFGDLDHAFLSRHGIALEELSLMHRAAIGWCEASEFR